MEFVLTFIDNVESFKLLLTWDISQEGIYSHMV